MNHIDGIFTGVYQMKKDYSHMIKPPSPDLLFKLIVDANLFKKTCNLGNRKQYLEEGKVENIISLGEYKHYKRLK